MKIVSVVIKGNVPMLENTPLNQLDRQTIFEKSKEMIGVNIEDSTSEYLNLAIQNLFPSFTNMRHNKISCKKKGIKSKGNEEVKPKDQMSEHLYQAIQKRLPSYFGTRSGKISRKKKVKGNFRVVSAVLITALIRAFEADEGSLPLKRSANEIFHLPPSPFEECWRLNFQIQIESNELKLEIIRNALEIVGREGGISDYHPYFRKFEVIQFEEMECRQK